jgi:hypothetical protein
MTGFRIAAAFAAIVLPMTISVPGEAVPPPKFSAFTHTVVVSGPGANVCPADGTATVIANPLANGNPGAVIVATYNTSGPPGGIIAPAGILTVFYDAAGSCGTPGRWVLTNENGGTSFVGGELINIIVGAP